MPKHTRYILLLLLTGLPAFAGSEVSPRRSRSRLTPLENYNVKLGSLALDFSYKSELSYDNNTNRATIGNAEDEGAAWENGLNTKLYWPVNRLLEFQSSLYLGYIGYFQGEGTEGLVADASTSNALELEIRLGNNSYLYVTDDININIESVYDLAEEDTEDLKMLENDFALQYEAAFSSLYSGGARFGRRDIIALDDDYENRDRVTHYLNLMFGWQMNESFKVQPYFNYAQHRYGEPFNNDANEHEVGVEVRYHLTEYTQALVGIGYQNIDFDNDHTPRADENAYGLTGRIAIGTDLTENTRHAFSLRHGRRLGTSRYINYVTDYLAAYSLQWRMAPNWRLQTSLSWLHGDEESADFGEVYQFFVGSCEVTYELTRTIELFSGYQYSDKNSDFVFGDFSRDRVWLGLNWDF